MNILILTHYYPPEVGAPQARLSEMASAWKKKGHQVRVLTCFPNHPTGVIPEAYQGERWMEEELNGIKVFRTFVYATPNKGFIKKTISHISFMVSSVIQGWRVAKGQDVILVSSPTFFSVISAWLLSRIFRIPYIFEVRDLWPAIFVELGILKNKWIIKLLEAIEYFLYRNAAAVVPVTQSFADYIEERGIAKSKLHVITNGVDLDFFLPRVKPAKLISSLRLDGKFIVLYIGAHGISQALSAIIEAAKKAMVFPDIHFLFIGEGAEKERVMTLAAQYQLSNITFLPQQPKEAVPDYYALMDVGLVPLRNIPLFDTFIPSKMFEMMAMQRPIVASVRGEAADILKRSEAALVLEPEDSVEICNAIVSLYQNRVLYQKLALKGRQFVAENYTREHLATKYIGVFDQIVSQKVTA